MKTKYDDLTIADDFLFCKILETRKDLCKKIIEVITQREIKELTDVRAQKSEKSTIGVKGVRFDVIFKDDEDTIYNLEMQTTNLKNLAKRSRYYQSTIDTSFLNSGGKYEDLPNSLVIFICTFDPFGYKKHLYTFRPTCTQDHSIVMDDGTYRLFVSTEGADSIGDECKDLLDYFGGRAVKGELAQNLQQEVDNAKLNEKWRSEFMQNMAFYMDAVSEGETKGRIEGRIEGRREGRLEGRQEGRIEGLETGREEKGIQVFLRCMEKGMDREEAQSIAEISDEQVEKALAGKSPKQ